ncbi:MAG: hypothetical protein AAF682_18760 [Planctomycetota bacterium]
MLVSYGRDLARFAETYLSTRADALDTAERDEYIGLYQLMRYAPLERSDDPPHATVERLPVEPPTLDQSLSHRPQLRGSEFVCWHVAVQLAHGIESLLEVPKLCLTCEACSLP